MRKSFCSANNPNKMDEGDIWVVMVGDGLISTNFKGFCEVENAHGG